jgi:hypothetical protein
MIPVNILDNMHPKRGGSMASAGDVFVSTPERHTHFEHEHLACRTESNPKQQGTKHLSRAGYDEDSVFSLLIALYNSSQYSQQPRMPKRTSPILRTHP